MARKVSLLILLSFELLLRQAWGFTVVLDPGHGGSDMGTVYETAGRRYEEKDLTLLLALETARILRARGIRAVLTRARDETVSLGDRTAIANRLKADAFLSIHMNSSQTPMVTGAEGLETYILNNTSDASSRSLARLENTVLDPEERAAAATSDDLDVALILRDLRLDANLSESKRLACTIQSSLLASAGFRVRNRGIKQALFHVLLGAEMPSALVEAGFVSSALDRNRVLDPRSRHAMAAAIARAILRFRDARGTLQARAILGTCQVR